MHEEEFRELISVVADQVRSLGMGDLASEANFVDPETRALPRAKTYLVNLLKALEVQWALVDRATVDGTLTDIGEIVGGDGPIAAFLADFPRDDEGHVPGRLQLRGIDEVSSVRADLRALIGALLEEPEEV